MIAQNLVENAVKYNTPGGRIRVEARAVNGAVEMTIGNTGDGIPKERAGPLFERFYRVGGGARDARAWAGSEHRARVGSSAWWRRRAGLFRMGVGQKCVCGCRKLPNDKLVEHGRGCLARLR